jgi:hypothetical protein
VGMGIHVIDISTEVFHLLQQRAPRFVAWSDEKPGPTQKILVEDDVYAELIDRAIAHHQTLDQVVRDACTKPKAPALASYSPAGNSRRAGGAN